MRIMPYLVPSFVACALAQAQAKVDRCVTGTKTSDIDFSPTQCQEGEPFHECRLDCVEKTSCDDLGKYLTGGTYSACVAPCAELIE